MNSRIWGIIGGFALVLALLSPYVLGSSKKVAQLFEAAEVLYEEDNYESAIAKYSEALKESKKLGAKTATIDEDFTTLVNLKIAMSYAKLAEQSDDANYYKKALEHIEEAASRVKLANHQENLTYLWGHILYKTGQLEQAAEKFTELIENFPNSRFVEEATEAIAHIKQQQDTEGSEEVVHPTDRVPLWINDPSKFEEFNKKKNRVFLVPNRLRVQKQYREAAEQYEVFANNNSSTKEVIYALYWSGWCYYEAASADETLFSKSRDAFQKLIDNYGDNPYTSKARERLCDIEEAESDKAIIDAEEAVHNAKQSNCRSRSIDTAIKDLDNAKQKQERGNYKAALRLAQEARDTAKRVTDKHETAKRYVEQGYNHLRQKQLETATEKAREALRIHPPYQNAKQLLEEIKQKYFDQGVNYIETKEERKAISPLKKAIDIDSQFKEAYYNLGFAYLQLGEFPQVITAAKKAIAIDPDYQDAIDLINSIDIGEN